MKPVMEGQLELLQVAAREAAERAYAPYSQFRVGAAVLADGNVYVGCNVENASYGLSMCAERTAIFKAISAGARQIEALAVSCIDSRTDDPVSTKMPCGACRQVMSEFAADGFVAAVDGVGTKVMGELLPQAFVLK